MTKPFTSTHKLDYLQAPANGDGVAPFKVGTCHGLMYQTPEAVVLLAVQNNKIGNGHFTDVLEWFEFSAKHQGLYFDVMHVWNLDLKKHLLEKQGFFALSSDHLRKEV